MANLDGNAEDKAARMNQAMLFWFSKTEMILFVHYSSVCPDELKAIFIGEVLGEADYFNSYINITSTRGLTRASDSPRW